MLILPFSLFTAMLFNFLFYFLLRDGDDLAGKCSEAFERITGVMFFHDPNLPMERLPQEERAPGTAQTEIS